MFAPRQDLHPYAGEATSSFAPSSSSSLPLPPPPRTAYAPEQPRTSTSTFWIPTPQPSSKSRSNAPQAYDLPAQASSSSSYRYLPAEASSSSNYYASPTQGLSSSGFHSHSPATAYTTNPRQAAAAVMSSTSSLLDADVDFDQFRRGGDDLGSVGSDITYYGEDGYAAAGTADEQVVVVGSRHSSFSSASSGFVEPLAASVEVPSSLSSSYHCQICGWATSLRDNFDSHLRAHDGDCLFQCFLDGCEAAFSDTVGLLAHTRRHRPLTADSACSNSNGHGGKRAWGGDEAAEGDVDQWVHTPQQLHKKVRVEPITPITPSMYQQQQRGVVPATVSRTLSYDESLPLPRPPRHNSYDAGVDQQGDGYAPAVHLPQPDAAPASGSVVSTFTLPSTPSSSTSTSGFAHPPPSASPVYIDAPPASFAARHPARRLNAALASPLPIAAASSSAPVDRGRFDPYPQSLPSSASMSVSHSLPPPPGEQFQTQTPPRGRTIHSRRMEQQGHYHHQQHGHQQQYFPAQATGEQEYFHPHSTAHLQSPVSPAGLYPPALIPIPSPSGAHTPSRRPSTSSGPSGGAASAASYTPSQAALLSAASMNRLFARLPAPSSSSSPSAASPALSSSSPYQPQPQPHSPLAPSYRSSPSTSLTPTPVRAGGGGGVTAVHPRYREPAPISPYNEAAAAQTRRQEKVHACGEEGCGKRFKRLEHLKRHERTHTLEKPYMCDVPGCERFFSRSDNLQQHRKTHEKNGKTARAMAASAAARAARAAAEIAAGMAAGGGDGGFDEYEE
ncbi:hypothetical protein JCM6882_004788 [Rhodosporidiobolus microsporus]